MSEPDSPKPPTQRDHAPHSAPEGDEPWVIFDADNTLWDVESLYDYARDKFAQHVSDYLKGSVTPKEIANKQREIDQNLGSIFGYQAGRFTRSFEHTALHYIDVEGILQVSGDKRQIFEDARRIANRVFEERACVYEDATRTLLRARRYGYRVGILTAGDRHVQERRIAQSGFGKLCDSVEIVDSKSEDNLRLFCTNYGVDIARSYLIGDSRRSDIAPGNAVGLTTILITNPNWDVYENDETQPCFTVQNLTQALDRVVRLVDPPCTRGRPVRVIFEGGGAKGIAHVGALKVLNERETRIDRVAGSSAGAIVAALVAADCTADQILDLQNAASGDHEAVIASGSFLKPNLAERIGAANWRRIRLFRKLASVPWTGAALLGVLVTAGLFTLPVAAGFSMVLALFYAVAIPLVVGVGLWGFRRFTNLAKLGFAGLDQFIDWYDGLLKKSPLFADFKEDRLITFQDFARRDRRAPVLIASDVTRQKLQILTYCNPDTEALSEAERQEFEAVNAMPVARAVAASAALPIVFQPVRFQINDRRSFLVDGGMLSNLPVWSVATERSTRETRNPIIAFELRERARVSSGAIGILGYVRGLISTVVSGGRILETRGVEGLHVVDIETAADVTAFDMGEDEKIAIYREGYEATRESLTNEISSVAWKLVPPSKMRPLLNVLHAECQKLFREQAGSALREALPHAVVNPDNPIEYPHLRINIMWVTRLGDLRIAYSYNMAGDTDDDLALPRDGGGAGKALKEGATTLLDMEEARYSHARYNMTKYDQALVRPSLKTLYSIPLNALDAEMPIEAVLNFDSDDDLVDVFKNDQVAEELEYLAEFVVDQWRALVAYNVLPDGGPDDEF